MVYEPVAAALGIGLNIREPDGKMIIDIGGGITEIVVISLSGIAAFQSLKVAGDSFDEEIQDHFRRSYNMAIGLKTAEQIKIKVGAVLDKLPETPEPLDRKRQGPDRRYSSYGKSITAKWRMSLRNPSALLNIV